MRLHTLLLLAGLLIPCLTIPVHAAPTYQAGPSTPRDRQLSGLWDQAAALHKQGNYTEAEAIYNQMLGLLASQPDAFWLRLTYSSRAGTRRKLNNLAGAYEDYTRAIAVAETPMAQAAQYLYRGAFRYGNSDPEGAIADYTEALKLNPDLGLVYYYRALTYADLKQFELAIADFKQLEQIHLRRGNREAAADARAYIEAMEQKQNGR